MVDMATLAIKVQQDGISQAQSGLDSLTKSGAAAEQQMGRTGSASSSMAKQMAILTAALASAYAAYKSLNDAIGYGMRVETLGVAMNVVAKNAGLSSDAIKYFSAQVKSAGITSTEAFSVITKAMVQGLDLNKMKELATRARDIAVVAGMNTSDAFATIMHGIESGVSRIFHTMGVAVRDQKTVFDEYATSIGKTGKELNQVEKAQAMLNEVMRASAGYAGAAAAADETAGKMLASLDRVIKDTYESFWVLFGPGVTTGIKELTLGFKDLQKWADLNRDSLMAAGVAMGTFIRDAGEAAIATGKWVLANFDLVKSLTELYIISRLIAWIQGMYTAMVAAQGGATLLRGAMAAYSIATGTAAYTTTVYTANAYGATTATVALTGSAVALNAAMGVLLATMGPLLVALAAYGAYKSLTGKAGYLAPAESALEPGVGLEATLGIKPPAAPFVGPPAPSASEMEMRRIQAKLEQIVKEGKDAADKAARESAPGHGAKGKGAESAQASVEKFIETMRQETAKGAGDTEAILNAWYSKQAVMLDQWAAKGANVTEADKALKEAYYSKLQKLDSDFQDWYIAGLGRTYEALVVAEDKKRKEVAGNEDKIAKVREVFDKKHQDLVENQQIEAINLMKGYLDSMSQMAPLLDDQLRLKEQSLKLEMELSSQSLDRMLREEKITQATYDEAKAMQALVNQAKKYSLERMTWQTLGVSGGIQMANIEAINQAKVWLANTTSQWIMSLPQTVSQPMASTFIDILRGRKTDFEELGWSMAQAMLQKMIEGWVVQALPMITSTLSGIFGSGSNTSLMNMFSWSPSAHGNVFRYARGGLTMGPTIFPMAGGFGLMGESGTEAVMPLTRTPGGDLGVRAVGGGSPINITIETHTKNPVQVTQSNDGQGNIKILFDELLEEAVQHGGKGARAMDRRYGTRPATTVR